ncbi:MAG: hypothetical protein IJ428_07030 [Clostridia bacterium]|nr:hypothetical protein [Clostridia bacterium]MBQ8552546.1 hypothetical protein [Clostridia bacterium]
MLYANLRELVRRSSSSRRFFFGLPVPLQLKLSEYDEHIRSAADLHRYAEAVEKHEHAVEIGDMLLK